MEVLVFAGLNALESQVMRAHVLRIPEVSLLVKKAQRLIDREGKTLDLGMYLCGSDEGFYSNISARALATAVVQLGLYYRYLKHNKTPKYLVGACNGESALRVATTEITFEEMVLQSQYVSDTGRRLQVVRPDGELPLAGIALTEYRVYKQENESDSDVYRVQKAVEMDLVKLLTQLLSEARINSVVNLGPGGMLTTEFAVNRIELYELRVVESIDLDPMMSPSLYRELEAAL